jgi:PilZ domain
MRAPEYGNAGEKSAIQASELPERRPSRRNRVLLSGVIVFDEGRRSIACAIRNLSENGALVTLPNNTHFPTRFYLINVRDRMIYRAKVIRCGVSDAGVAFEETIPLTDKLDPALGFLKQIWLAHVAR